MALVAAAILFTVFSANVIAGSFFGGPFFSDVGEMLTLLASAIAFVVGILAREAAEGGGREKAEP